MPDCPLPRRHTARMLRAVRRLTGNTMAVLKFWIDRIGHGAVPG
jgi:hypothetical protein